MILTLWYLTRQCIISVQMFSRGVCNKEKVRPPPWRHTGSERDAIYKSFGVQTQNQWHNTTTTNGSETKDGKIYLTHSYVRPSLICCWMIYLNGHKYVAFQAKVHAEVQKILANPNREPSALWIQPTAPAKTKSKAMICGFYGASFLYSKVTSHVLVAS